MPRHFAFLMVLTLAAVMVACTSAPPPPSPTIQPTYTLQPTYTPYPTMPVSASNGWTYVEVGDSYTIFLQSENLDDPPYYPATLHIECKGGEWDWYLSSHPIIQENPGQYSATFRIDDEESLDVPMLVVAGFEGVIGPFGSDEDATEMIGAFMGAQDKVWMKAWSEDQWDMRGIQEAANKWLQDCASP